MQFPPHVVATVWCVGSQIPLVCSSSFDALLVPIRSLPNLSRAVSLRVCLIALKG